MQIQTDRVEVNLVWDRNDIKANSAINGKNPTTNYDYKTIMMQAVHSTQHSLTTVHPHCA